MSTTPIGIRLAIDGVGQVVSGVKTAEQAVGGLGRSTQSAAIGFERLHSVVSRMRGAFTALAGLSIGGVGLAKLAEMADGITSLNARLADATGSGAAAAASFARLRDIANQSRQPLQDVGSLYLGLSRSAADLGARQSEIVRFTSGVAASLRLSGASAQASSGALTQLAQAMGGATVQAEEFNSLVDGAPVLLRTVAANLGTAGLSMGELRERIKRGEVTSREFFEAFLKGSADLEARASAMPTTIGGAFNVLQNNLAVTAGRLDQQYQVTQRVSSAVLALATNMDAAVAAVKVAGIVALAYWKQTVVIPAVVAAWTTAKTALTGALVRFQLAAAISGSATAVLAAEMKAAAAASFALQGGVSRLAVALGVLGAAFTGWQIGAVLREEFLEAQLAGIAFVNGTLKAWEALKYGAQVAWAYIGDAWRNTVQAMGGALAGFLDAAAGGFSAVGMDGVARSVSGWAAAARTATTNSRDLGAELGTLRSSYQAATGQIDAITGDMADEAIAAAASKNAHKELNDEVQKITNSRAKLGESQNQFVASLVKELDKLREQNATFGQGEDAVLAYRAAREGMLAQTDRLRTQIATEREALETKKNEVELRKAAIKAMEDEAKVRADLLAKHDAAITAQDATIQGLEDELYGIENGKAALLERVLLREQERVAMMESEAVRALVERSDAAEYERLRTLASQMREVIDLRRQVAGATASAEVAEANARAATDAARDWQRAADQIGQSMADALMRGGKSAAEYITGLFRTMVLRPIIQAVTQPAANAVLGLMGMGAAGPAAAGGGSLLSTVGSLGSLAGSLGSLGTIAGTGFGLTMAGNTAGALASAGAMMSGGSVASGTAMGLGALGPYALGAAAVYSLLKGMDRSGTPHRGSVVGVDSAGMASTLWGDPSQITRNRDAQTDSALAALGQSASGLLNSLSRAAGGAGGFSSVLKFASDNTDPSVGGFNLSRGGQTLSDWGVYQGDFRRYDKDAQAGFEAYTRDVVAATRGALDQIDLPNWAREQFRGLEEGADLQALAGVADSVAQTMDALRGMESGLRDLGGVFAALAGQGSDALYQVAQLAGGMDALSASTGAYFSAYYTDAERAAIATQSMTVALAEVGIALPASREAFRQVVDGLDVSTEAGRRQFVAMMQVAGAFAEVTPAAAVAAETVTSVAETMRSAADILREREGLETQLLQLQGDTAALRALELAALDPSNRALQERIYALQDERSAAEVAAQAASESAQQQASIASERAGLEMELLRMQGDTAAIRAIERAALDESNRSLFDQINALRDLQAAADVAAEATVGVVDVVGQIKEAASQPVTAAGITAAAKAQIEVDSFRRAMDTARRDLLQGSRYPEWTERMINDPIAQATGKVRVDLYATGLLVWQEQQRLMMDAAAQGWAETNSRLRQSRDQADDPRPALLREQVQGTQELIDSLDAMRRSMVDLTNELIGGELDPANPETKYAAEREFVTGLGRQALAGDMAAAAMFRQEVGGFLQASQGFNASGGAYATDFTAMIDLLTKISASMERQQGTAEATLTVQQAGLSSVAGSTERTAQATAAQARTARVLEQRAIE